MDMRFSKIEFQLRRHVRILMVFLTSAGFLPCLAGASVDPEVERALDCAHSNLVSRFVGKDGLLRGWEGPDPSPKDCLEGRPSYIGWATPVENGPMFTGSWLPAVCARARRSGSAEDRALARRLVAGLMLSASVSDVPGFISRGTATDGKTHYPWGSTDQTGPWYLGLYAYLQSGLPEAGERQAIVAKIREVSDDLESRGWMLPCDGVFKDRETCGNMRDEIHWYRETTQYLFMLKATAVATGDTVWEDRYRAALLSSPTNCYLNRLEILEEGYVVDMPNIRVEPKLLWIYTHQHLMHAELALMEKDPAIRRRLVKGLKADARRVACFIDSAPLPPTVREVPYSAADWTKFITWSPQRSMADSRKVAATLKKEGLRRKREERASVTVPLCAAVISAYSCDPAARAAAVRRIVGTDFSALNLCEFFWAEVWQYACGQADVLNADGAGGLRSWK